MSAKDDWEVLPHGPLERLEDNLWRVEGALKGIPLQRVMTIARRRDGKLVVHNPMALDDDGMRELEKLGKPAYIVVPNGQHRLDAPRFAARYPDAKVIAPPGGRSKIEKVVRVDGEVADVPADDWVTVSIVDGTKEREAMLTVLSGDRTTVVFADAVFNMPHAGGAAGWIFKHVTGSSGGPRVSRLVRWLMVGDKRALASHLDRLATPSLARVIVAHHEMITDQPADVLRRVAQSLR